MLLAATKVQFLRATLVACMRMKTPLCTTGGTLSQSNARQQKYNSICSAPELRHIQKYKTARCSGNDMLLGPDRCGFAGFPKTEHSKVQYRSIHKIGDGPSHSHSGRYSRASLLLRRFLVDLTYSCLRTTSLRIPSQPSCLGCSNLPLA